uniref:Uncharacterized protein n=1 Tax=Molossus molossus TaxID=27622 RepID=A0A7J8GQ13_MOLMO|nr:hypothetical protein HJG59_011272 [Molossus molossus]
MGSSPIYILESTPRGETGWSGWACRSRDLLGKCWKSRGKRATGLDSGLAVMLKSSITILPSQTLLPFLSLFRVLRNHRKNSLSLLWVSRPLCSLWPLASCPLAPSLSWLTCSFPFRVCLPLCCSISKPLTWTRSRSPGPSG